MTERFTISDRRGRTASASVRGGVVLTPPSAPGAAHAHNRTLAAEMNRNKLAGMQRTGANIQMAMPKVRQPLGSLADKGIPFNTEDPKELMEARKLSRLYYRTHDLVPLLIDIYAKFPVVGLEFQCLAAETQVVTSEGTRPIGELSGGVHRILTTGGKWVEAPFKSFGEQPLMRLVLQRNGRQREFFATPNHRWLVRKVDHNKNYCRDEIHTSELKPGMKLAPSYGRNIIHASNPSPFGIAHGMTFGDGSRNTSGGGCHVDLYGEKDFNMLQYFAGCTIYRGYRKDVSVDGVRVNDLPRFFKDRPALTESTSYLYGWLAGYFAADGTVSKKGECFLDSSTLSNLEYVRDICHVLGIHTSDIYSYDREDGTLPQGGNRGPHTLHRLRFANESLTEKFFCIPQHRDRWKEYAGRKSMEIWQVVSVEETDRVEEVYCAVVPGTEAFTLDGNILTGNSKDSLIEKFYSEMFLNTLNYEEYLQDLGREFFTVGEANSLAHFSEELGVWSSEEIIDPDIIKVSRSIFVQEERVQLLVKDMVEKLRSGPNGITSTDESPSERMERTWEYQELSRLYPEIIQAASQDDGLDVSPALISRIVNRTSPNDLRGTPHLMRSFRTLMMEESLNAAQDSVCLPAGSPVLTSRGVKSIEDVTAADEVLTHCGRYRRVVEPMVREADEPGVTIRWWYDQPLTLTGEHPVYVRRPINMPSHHYHGQRHNDWAEGFIPAREVRTYDQVLHPSSPDSGKEYVSVWEHLDQKDWVVYDPSDVALGMTGHDWYDNAATQTKRVSRNRVAAVLNHCEASPGDILRHNRFRAKTQHFAAEYKLTEDLLWLIGLHVADGSAQINNSSGAPHGSVVITLGDHEGYLADRAVRVFSETFGITPTVTPCWGGKKAIKVSANSLPLAMWFRKMCGVNGSKSFPHWAFGLTVDQTNALIQGWMDGDGTTDNVRTLGSSAYRQLQESAAWLMRRSGLITSSRRGKRQGGFSGLGYQYTVTTVKTPRRAYPADQGGYWVEVRSVEHHQVAQTVYNLEVEEDHSYCAPIAVHNCDRLYAPLILATLGLDNLGDGEPWIPTPADLDDVRDDLQAALSADFKLMVHNMGLNIQSVFGRESVPRFDQDYDRITSKLLQAWGIGEALIAGGGTGTYASSALNREVCEQLMFSFQNKIRRHIIKRCEVVAEAQRHYDYELKGGVRRPLYREVIEYDPETGKEYIRKVPKLLIPEIHFSTLNLRDESTERAFIAQLKAAGVPVSDKAMSMNLPLDFEQELERSANETVAKMVAQAQAMDKVQKICDQQRIPYPPELASELTATLQLRQQLAQTDMIEGQAEMQEQQIKQMMPAGQLGLLPGTVPMPPGGGEEEGQQKSAATQTSNPPGLPHSSGPGSTPPTVTGPPMPEPVELPRNRIRPPESDEQRKNQPKTGMSSRFKAGPSSYGRSRFDTEGDVTQAVRRLEVVSSHVPSPSVEDLINDPEFYQALNITNYEGQLRADWPEIQAGKAQDSKKILEDALIQYEEIFGVEPKW